MPTRDSHNFGDDGFLSGYLKDFEIRFLEFISESPHRFDPDAAEASTVALIISRLHALGFVHVDEDSKGKGAIISLSPRGYALINREGNKIAKFLQ